MSPSFSYGRNKTYQYYVCTAVEKMDKNACEVRRVSSKSIEFTVLERIGQIANTPKIVEKIIQNIKEQSQGKIPTLQEELSKIIIEARSIKDEANGLLRLAAKTEENKLDFVVERIRELENLHKSRQAKIELLRKEIGQWKTKVVSGEQIQRLMSQFKLVFDQLEPMEQKELVRLLIKEVQYNLKEGYIKIGFRNLNLGSLPSMTAPTDCFDESICWLPGPNASRT